MSPQRRQQQRSARGDLVRLTVVWLFLVALIAWQLLAPPAAPGSVAKMFQDGVRTAFPWLLPVEIAIAVAGAVLVGWGWRRLRADP